MAKKAKTESQKAESKAPSEAKKKVSSMHPPKQEQKKAVLFVEITPEKQFVLCDGRILKNYLELAQLLETVSDDIFCYHVNIERNDFANWVNDVFNEEQLAAQLRNAKGKAEMMALLYKSLFEKLERMMG